MILEKQLSERVQEVMSGFIGQPINLRTKTELRNCVLDVLQEFCYHGRIIDGYNVRIVSKPTEEYLGNLTLEILYRTEEGYKELVIEMGSV